MILIGFMGVGKTTVGRCVAELLGQPFVDLDEVFVVREGCSINDFIQENGEEAFRLKEHQLLLNALPTQGVIATGGGCVELQANRQWLAARSDVFYLEASFETHYQQIQADVLNVRPLAQSKTKSELRDLYDRRVPLYREAATHSLWVEGKQVTEIASDLLECLGKIL